MPYFCKGCGQRRSGESCKKWCVEKYGHLGADMIPRLDGMVFINDDGSGIPRHAQQQYDQSACKRGVPFPKSIQGSRPNGWNEAMHRIGERAAQIIVGSVSSGVVLPCGED